VEECDLVTIVQIIEAAVWNVGGIPANHTSIGREANCAAVRSPLRHHDTLCLAA
jgi:hypothetical protein